MSVHPSRVVASLLLLAGGFVVGVSVLAIGLARVLVEAGMTIRPADAALLADLIPVLPFVAGFALVSIAAGLGLIAGQDRAENLGIGAAAVAVVVGGLVLALIIIGRDPFASTESAKTTADGIAIVGTFTVTYVAVMVALGAARLRKPASSAAVPAVAS
jgi:hypothetical protein